jgi:hypothetical protein
MLLHKALRAERIANMSIPVDPQTVEALLIIILVVFIAGILMNRPRSRL